MRFCCDLFIYKFCFFISANKRTPVIETGSDTHELVWWPSPACGAMRELSGPRLQNLTKEHQPYIHVHPLLDAVGKCHPSSCFRRDAFETIRDKINRENVRKLSRRKGNSLIQI